MRSKSWRVLVIVAGLALAVAAAAGCSRDTGTDQTDTGDAGVKMEDLANQSLSEQQEGLVGQYLELGGFGALEKRFGKSSMKYETLADGSSNGMYALPDGRFWYYETGANDKGTTVVISHSVEGTTGMTMTDADKAFVSTIVDGKTTLDEANAYVKSIAGAEFEPPVPNKKAAKAPVLVWNLEDGSGFAVVDLTGLSKEQLAELYIEEGMAPYQILWWDATHWRAYPEGDEAEEE